MSWELYCGLHSVRQKDRRRTSRGGLHRESRKSKHQTQDVISISGWSRLSAADQEGESKKGALKTAKGNKKTIFFLDHCSSCRFKSCVDDFKVIYLTPRCDFVIKKKSPEETQSWRKKRRKWQLLRYMSCPGSGAVCFSS